jgi:hypothetical protein
MAENGDEEQTRKLASVMGLLSFTPRMVNYEKVETTKLVSL